MKHKRNLKVYATHHQRGNRYSRHWIETSKIILQGNWLKQADFKPSDSIEVMIDEGMIILKVVPVIQNRLDRNNCNKAKCKSCIFHTNGNQVQLSPERFAEIQMYLMKGEASHICHTTNKTCYGALEFQAQLFSRMGFIPNNSVDSLLSTAAKHLSL